MEMSLDALRQQHLLETQNQAVVHRQEQEHLLQQQQIQLREQEELFRAKHEHDSPHDQHQAWQQFQQHVHQVVAQQQQELLRQQYEAQMALRQQQWHNEQEAMKQQMQQQLHHHQQAPPPLVFNSVAQHQQHHTAHTPPAFHHAGQYQHTPPTPQQPFQGQHQQHQMTGGDYFLSNSVPHNSLNNSDHDTDMDLDDEAQVTSIAASIQQLRHASHHHGDTRPSAAHMPAGWDTDVFSSTAGRRKHDPQHQQQHLHHMDQREDFDTEDAPPRAVVVLDTNVLISHLNFVKDLVSNYGSIQGRRRIWQDKAARIPRVTFILPWVVIQELDNLKSSHRNRSGSGEVDLSGKAQRAIYFIHEELAKDENARGLWGQKLGERVDAKATKNDDAILDCCRYYKTLFPDVHQTRISLLSNDRNLGVKAMIHEIGHISFQNSGFVVGKVVELMLHGRTKDLTSGEADYNYHHHHSITTPSTSVSAAAATSPTTRHRRSSSVWKSNLDNQNDLYIDDPERAASLNPEGMSFEQVTEYVSRIGKPKKRKNSKSHSRGYRLDVNDQELERIKSTAKPAKPPPGMNIALFQLTNQIVGTVRQFLELAVMDHLAAFYGSRWRILCDYGSVRVCGSDLNYETRRIQAPLQLMRRSWGGIFKDLYGTSKSPDAGALAAERHLESMADFIKRWERVEMFGLGKIYRKDVDQFLEDVDVILAGLLVKPQLSPATEQERAEAAALRNKQLNGDVSGNKSSIAASCLSAYDMDDTMDEGDPCSAMLTHQDQEELYAPKLRIHLVREWKDRCKAMPM